jgi:hypothetical protein
MSQTASTLASVMKEAWTSDRCQKQFEDAALPYQRIQKVPATMIGKQAQVPIIKNNGGGYTSFGAAGGRSTPPRMSAPTRPSTRWSRTACRSGSSSRR